MEAARTWAASIPLADLLALAGLLACVAWGLLRGLGRAFGGLLWTLLALGLGAFLAPMILAWMPNTTGTDDPRTLMDTYGVLTGLILVLPLVARLLGGGDKASTAPVGHRALGAVAGVATCALLVTLALPFAWRLEALAVRSAEARAPGPASVVAETLSALFPAAFRDELARIGDGDAADGEAPR